MNIVILAGNLTADPELRYLPGDKAVCNFRIAVDDGTETLFIDVAAWDTLAKSVAEHQRKGSKVAVAGALRSESWTDKDGVQKSKMTVRARSVEFMSPPRKEADPRPQETSEPELPF